MTLHSVHVQSMEKGGGGDDITQCTRAEYGEGRGRGRR